MRIKTKDPTQGSVLIIVLWIALGLVAITLYFANSMSFELRASDNRASAIIANHAIDGAARYLTYVLSTFSTNGAMPDPALFQSDAVAVGDSHFWLIGRDTNDPPIHSDQVFFGLTDEASKLNLNTATPAMLEMLPWMTVDLAANINTWRSTNVDSSSGGFDMYALQSPPYVCKSAPFETTEELRLVYGADLELLVGEDANLNGILDPNETDKDRNGRIDPGILEYVTVYSREPNTASDGSQLVNVRSLTSANSDELRSLLETNLSSSRAQQILAQLGLVTASPGRGGPNPQANAAAQNTTVNSRCPLEFYVRSGMTPEEFATIAPHITTTTNAFIEGRININTASAVVLDCIPGLTNRTQDLISYRQSNPDKLTSAAWLLEALSLRGDEARQVARQIGDTITTHSYQFSADVAALGPYGRGYQRVRFIFDTSEGTPRIIYRRDLTHAGWALGKNVRDVQLAKNKP